MSISTTGGAISFAKQSAKVGDGGAFDPGAVTWHRHRALSARMGAMQEQQAFPPEVGGSLVPQGMYKQAVYFMGELNLIPRLENSFGLLMYGAMGQASSVSNTDADGNSVTGVNTHIFRYNPDDNSDQPWMAVRRMLPHPVQAKRFGETGYDCKIGAVQFNIPPKGLLQATLAILGRDVIMERNPSWTYAGAYEESTSSANVSIGGFYIGGIKYPLVGAQFQLPNQISTPDQEAVIGSFRPDDIITLMRNAMIRISYKYEDSGLYQKLLTGTDTGTTWSPAPYADSKSGATFAFDLRVKSVANIPGTSTPYEMRIRGGRVVWSVDGPPELAPGNILIQQITGQVVEPAAGEDYIQVVLVNGQASY